MERSTIIARIAADIAAREDVRNAVSTWDDCDIAVLVDERTDIAPVRRGFDVVTISETAAAPFVLLKLNVREEMLAEVADAETDDEQEPAVATDGGSDLVAEAVRPRDHVAFETDAPNGGRGPTITGMVTVVGGADNGHTVYLREHGGEDAAVYIVNLEEGVVEVLGEGSLFAENPRLTQHRDPGTAFADYLVSRGNSHGLGYDDLTVHNDVCITVATDGTTHRGTVKELALPRFARQATDEWYVSSVDFDAETITYRRERSGPELENLERYGPRTSEEMSA